ncbi:acyl carrier protein [Microvirga sp. M2]|uniref:acyl carrier protein n=1 Tax=Microvirga sp. M2 TaxID=3073270 RepID=UPI0039C413A3
MTHQLEANVAREIVDLCKTVGGSSVTHVDMDMSLTHDLHFDSGQLMQFFSRVEQLYAGLALDRWFIEHCANGRDTVGGVVRYIADALPRAASEFSYNAHHPPRSGRSSAGAWRRGPAGRS